MATTIDFDAPVASIRALARPTSDELDARQRSLSGRLVEGDGLTVPELARRRSIARSSVVDAEKAGPRVSLDALREYAKACGFDVEVRVKKIDRDA
jgi:hypothetical protein